MKFVVFIRGMIVCGLSAWAGCTGHPSSGYATFDGFAQGSTYHLVVGTTDTAGLAVQVDSLLEAIDASMSLYREDSRLCRLNRNETDTLDEGIAYCLEEAARVSRLSDGAYDVTIKPVTEALGFAASEAADRVDLDSLMRYVGYEKIRIEDGRLVKAHPNVQIDLNSISQGYTADRLGRLMERRGIADYLVEIGGEIYCRGRSPRGDRWIVGIDEPYEGNFIPGERLQVRLRLTDKGLATSGNYRKFRIDESGRKVVHTVDARTGRCRVSNLLSATVVAENATLADVYGTLMMIVGLEASIRLLDEHPELWGYLVYVDEDNEYRTYISPGLREHVIR